MPSSARRQTERAKTAPQRLTIAADFLGERISDAQRALNILVPGNPSFAMVNGTYNTGKAALGIKINPIGNLLISLNVLPNEHSCLVASCQRRYISVVRSRLRR
jgi:hypothetical protein